MAFLIGTTNIVELAELITGPLIGAFINSNQGFLWVFVFNSVILFLILGITFIYITKDLPVVIEDER
jgi:hypothetical protein